MKVFRGLFYGLALVAMLWSLIAFVVVVATGADAAKVKRVPACQALADVTLERLIPAGARGDRVDDSVLRYAYRAAMSCDAAVKR